VQLQRRTPQLLLEHKRVRLMTIGGPVGEQSDSLGLISASHTRANRYRLNAKRSYQIDSTPPYKGNHDRDVMD